VFSHLQNGWNLNHQDPKDREDIVLCGLRGSAVSAWLNKYPFRIEAPDQPADPLAFQVLDDRRPICGMGGILRAGFGARRKKEDWNMFYVRCFIRKAVLVICKEVMA
jgi:hypothetical protein